MRFLINGILLVVVFFFIFKGMGLDIHPQPRNVSAASLPAGLQSVNATELSTEIREIQDGHAILFLYTSWCPYCKKQIEAMHEISQQRPEIRILSISLDDDPQALHAFLQKRPHLKFESRIFTGPGDIRQIISAAGGQYDGGIPYNGIITEGRIVSQAMGYTGAAPLLNALN